MVFVMSIGNQQVLFARTHNTQSCNLADMVAEPSSMATVDADMVPGLTRRNAESLVEFDDEEQTTLLEVMPKKCQEQLLDSEHISEEGHFASERLSRGESLEGDEGLSKMARSVLTGRR